MQTRNPLLDDIARVFAGAAGAAGGVREEVAGRIRAQFERILSDMDLVTREEFEVVQAMAAKARQEQEDLQERVSNLEARLATLDSRPDTGQEMAERQQPEEPQSPADDAAEGTPDR